jgi:hypothetical membrane protein
MKNVSGSGRLPSATQRLLAVCGIVGPIAYAVVVATLGFLQEGYSHVRNTMSELGADDAPYAIVMNTAGLPLLGLLMIAFALGLHRGIGDGRGSKVGPASFATSGVSLTMTAVFQCDPGCEDVTTVGTLHSAFATVAAVATILGLLAIFVRFRGDAAWHGYAAYTLATVVATVALSALYGFAFEAWEGALQRVSMALPLIWVEVLAVRLLRWPIAAGVR